MDYLICEKCKNYYKLKPGEKPEDFSSKCECGKKLKYTNKSFHIDKPDWEEFLIEDVCQSCEGKILKVQIIVHTVEKRLNHRFKFIFQNHHKF